MIATNETAQAYDKLQNSIDWCTANINTQCTVMEKMLKVLSQAKSNTVIFDYGSIDLRTGEKIYQSAGELWNRVNRRLFSTINRKNIS